MSFLSHATCKARNANGSKIESSPKQHLPYKEFNESVFEGFLNRQYTGVWVLFSTVTNYEQH